MKERITIYTPAKGLQRSYAIERVPFDMVEDGVIRECWVRYRGGRLFVRSTCGGSWHPIRFEPKKGNAYSLD